MTSKKEDPNEAAARKAREHLQRIEQQSEKILGAPGSDGEQFDANDPIEIWGKRIGIGLSLLLGVYLIYHFYTTYFS